MRQPFRTLTLSLEAKDPKERDTMSSAAEESSRSELHPAVRIGQVHLRVADLESATSFYRDVLGFEVTALGSDFDLPGAAFLAAGDYHHHIGLNTWHSQGGTPPPEEHTGLHHFAILYPDRCELARAVERLLERGYPIGGAEDHGATISVYLSDPDGKGLELFYDRPRGVGNPQGRTVRSSRAIGGLRPHFLVPMHPSAWKRNSANFACDRF
jgi:catechol 2,3-dioxygenase